MTTETIDSATSKKSTQPAAAAPPIEVKEVAPEAQGTTDQKTVPVEPLSRKGRADAIIRRNVLWSLAAGVVPFPLFDLAAVSGVQMKMLAELSDLYGVAFRAELAKPILGSLFSGLLGVGVGTAVGVSLAKFIPVVGAAIGLTTVPLVSAAFTHATGKVFMMHFEAGGTLLDFDPHAMRSFFKHEFEKAKATVATMQDETNPKAPAPKVSPAASQPEAKAS